MIPYEWMLRRMLSTTKPTDPDNHFSQIDNNMPGEDKQVVGSEIFADKEIFPEYPTTGPLAKYRQNATFDWRKLKLMVEDEEALLMRKKIWGFARKHPVFQKSMTDRLTMDEQRHLATKRMMLGHQQHFFGIDDVRRLLIFYFSIFLKCFIFFSTFDDQIYSTFTSLR